MATLLVPGSTNGPRVEDGVLIVPYARIEIVKNADGSQYEMPTNPTGGDIGDHLSQYNHSLLHNNSMDHAPGSDNQDLSGKVDKEIGKGLSAEDYTTAEKASVATAYSHSQAVHAPDNAQKNSDITKAEIEAKLTGEIASHSHAGGGGGLGYAINVMALTSSPADGATIYFGMLPKAPTTTANISKVYIPKTGTIKCVEIYCYSGTAGTNQAWSLYVRKNNATDYLIATLSVATNERRFYNAALSIPVVAGDYIEIKGVQPTWTTNPLTTIYGGYLYIE